jgi:hypothetical protein
MSEGTHLLIIRRLNLCVCVLHCAYGCACVWVGVYARVSHPLPAFVHTCNTPFLAPSALAVPLFPAVINRNPQHLRRR